MALIKGFNKLNKKSWSFYHFNLSSFFMRILKNTLLISLLGFLISAYTYKRSSDILAEPLKIKDSLQFTESPACNISISTLNFETVSDSFYKAVFCDGKSLDRKVFNYALKGYIFLLKQGALLKKDTLTIIDYSLSANKKRLWVMDLKNLKILFYELVAHGRNSGNEYAKAFSNTSNSFKSSIGFFLTGDIYNGKHETSLKLFGIERKYNSNAFERGIVIHGANYVSESYINENQRLGRSLGCPAVSENVINDLATTISNGTCVFAYYPNKTYLKGSRVLRGK